MKQASRNGLIVAAVAALAVSASAAQASVLQFNYRFADGNTFGGQVEGTLGADRNTFTVAKLDQLYGNGMLVANNSSDALTVTNNILTLNGVGISFQVNDQNGSILADIEHGTPYNPMYTITTYGSSLPTEYSQTFTPSTYSASVLPEPATAGLLDLMLAGFGVMRRRFRPS